jgi:energy-converting hydrogenase Eha subunit G
LYVIINSSAYAATIYASSVIGNTTPAGSGVSLAANSSCFVRCDGTNIRDAIDHISGTLFVEDALTLGDGLSVANNLSVTGSAAFGVSQTATITTANPAVITVANAPQNNTTVSFTTTGELPANITAGTLYYVVSRTSTTFRIATSVGGASISTLGGTQSGTHTVSTVPTAATAATGSNSAQLATTGFVTSAIAAIPSDKVYQTLTAVVAATTANITLSATQNIDGITVAVDDRVLVKNQTSAQDNGVYVVAAGVWSRSTDANTATEIAAAQVPVLKGTDNGGKTFITNFKSTDTLGTTAMSWDFLITATSPTITTPTITTPTITDPNISGAVMTSMASSVLTSETLASLSGTVTDITGIPPWAKRVTILIDTSVTSAATQLAIQLITASGAVITGYTGGAASTASGSTGYLASSGTRFPLAFTSATTMTTTVQLLNITSNKWVLSSTGGTNSGAGGTNSTGSGSVNAGAALTGIRITTVAGTATFNSGTANIIYE